MKPRAATANTGRLIAAFFPRFEEYISRATDFEFRESTGFADVLSRQRSTRVMYQAGWSERTGIKSIVDSCCNRVRVTCLCSAEFVPRAKARSIEDSRCKGRLIVE